VAPRRRKRLDPQRRKAAGISPEEKSVGRAGKIADFRKKGNLVSLCREKGAYGRTSPARFGGKREGFYREEKREAPRGIFLLEGERKGR